MYKTKITFFNNFCLPSVSVKEKQQQTLYTKIALSFWRVDAKILESIN